MSEAFVKKLQMRDKDGLLEDLDYVYDEKGLINWRGMIKPEFLTPNNQKTQETDIAKLDDSQILILLGGVKDLAQVRGFSDITYQVHAASNEYVAASCRIIWIPNYETEGREVTFESLADAHLENTNGFGRLYLMAIAENRAFARCVRNFLRINIVSKDELKEDDSSSPTDAGAPNVYRVLSGLMEEKKVTWDRIQSRLVKDGVEGADKFAGITDIPQPIAYELIALLKKKKS